MIKTVALVMISGIVLAGQNSYAAQQSRSTTTAAPDRKDIPTIAKAANRSIVSIVMSDETGKPIAQGSGFFVSSDGLVVTNYHVIAEGSSAVVKLPDGAFYPIDGVVASDKTRDVAIIKAHGSNFRTLILGNSDRLQVGEEVVAIGNPLSLESTVSNGIVSGIRNAEKLGGKFLQITTPISPGSSGGPLFNMAGEVVGITTMKLEGSDNLNFAIPINDVKRLLQDYDANSRPRTDPSLPPGVTEVPITGPLPNEHQSASTDAPFPTGSGQPMNSPAYQSYQELIKSGDNELKVGTYACFEDDSQNKGFMIIEAHLWSKQSLLVRRVKFANGVSDPNDTDWFQGPVSYISNDGVLIASLPRTHMAAAPSHETDAFEWGPDVLVMKAGVGKLAPGQLRISYEFKMQRSTGRYSEEIVVGNALTDGDPIITTGKCIRIPNTQTPEETYGLNSR